MTIDQATANQLAAAYTADPTNTGALQSLVNSTGVTQEDVAQYFPTFNIATSGLTIPSNATNAAQQSGSAAGASEAASAAAAKAAQDAAAAASTASQITDVNGNVIPNISKPSIIGSDGTQGINGNTVLSSNPTLAQLATKYANDPSGFVVAAGMAGFSNSDIQNVLTDPKYVTGFTTANYAVPNFNSDTTAPLGSANNLTPTGAAVSTARTLQNQADALLRNGYSTDSVQSFIDAQLAGNPTLAKQNIGGVNLKDFLDQTIVSDSTAFQQQAQQGKSEYLTPYSNLVIGSNTSIANTGAINAGVTSKTGTTGSSTTGAGTGTGTTTNTKSAADLAVDALPQVNPTYLNSQILDVYNKIIQGGGTNADVAKALDASGVTTSQLATILGVNPAYAQIQYNIADPTGSQLTPYSSTTASATANDSNQQFNTMYDQLQYGNTKISTTTSVDPDTGSPTTTTGLYDSKGNLLNSRVTSLGNGVYDLQTPSAGGIIHTYVQADANGNVSPITDYTNQISYQGGQHGGFINQTLSSLGPIGKIAAVVALNALLPGAGEIGAELTGADAASTTALTAGGSAIGAVNGGVIAAMNGQDVTKGVLTGALGGGLGANASNLATNVLGKDTLSSISSTLGGTFTPTQVSQIVGNAFTKSVVAAANSGNTSNLLGTFASNLVTSGLGTTASNAIYDQFEGKLSDATLSSLAKAVGNMTSATTAAAVSSGGDANAMTNALVTSGATSLGNFLGSTTANAVKSSTTSNTGTTKVSDTGSTASGSISNIATDPGSYSDAKPGTMTTMSNGEPGIVLDNGKIASLVDYRNAVASGQSFSIDGIMQTGSDATSLLKNAVSSSSTTSVDVSGTGAVVNAENASKLGFDTSQLPDGYQLVDAATSDAYYAAYGHNPPVTPLPDGTYVTMLPTSEIESLNSSSTDASSSGLGKVTVTAQSQNGTNADGTTALNPVTVVGKKDNTDNTTTLNPVTIVGKNDNTDTSVTPVTLNPVTIVSKKPPVEQPQIIDPKPPVVQPPVQPPVVKPPVVPGTTITTPATKTTTTTEPSVSQTSSSTTTGALPANLIGTMLASAAPAERAKLMQDLKQIYPELAHLDPKILSLLSGEASNKHAESLMQNGVNMLQAPAASGSVPLSPISGSSGQTGLTPSSMTSPLMQGNYNALSSAGLQMMAGQQGALPSFKKGGTVEHVPQFITGATGHYVKGEGDGQSDDIPAMLADGEYVFDADTVAALGNGSSDAGAEVLDKLREAIRKHKRSAPPDKIPPKAKSPLEYLKGVKL